MEFHLLLCATGIPSLLEFIGVSSSASMGPSSTSAPPIIPKQTAKRKWSTAPLRCTCGASPAPHPNNGLSGCLGWNIITTQGITRPPSGLHSRLCTNGLHPLCCLTFQGPQSQLQLKIPRGPETKFCKRCGSIYWMPKT